MKMGEGYCGRDGVIFLKDQRKYLAYVLGTIHHYHRDRKYILKIISKISPSDSGGLEVETIVNTLRGGHIEGLAMER